MTKTTMVKKYITFPDDYSDILDLTFSIEDTEEGRHTLVKEVYGTTESADDFIKGKDSMFSSSVPGEQEVIHLVKV